MSLRNNGVGFNSVECEGKFDELIRWVNNAFAYFSSTGTLSTASEEQVEQNKLCRLGFNNYDTFNK